ncbi:MAG: hypothetical protein JRF42_05395, partial [Deltaproteobacteria bacterium]|nr:hypothetical protein [Deltaproteobacteria bacterium]
MGAWFGLISSNPPTPTRNPPCRTRRFALACRRFAPSFAFGSRYRLLTSNRSCEVGVLDPGSRALHGSSQQGEAIVKTISMIIVTALVLSAGQATAQQGEASTVTTEVPQQQPYPECRQINKGGPIAGIVVASVFWWLLPMSIPVW